MGYPQFGKVKTIVLPLPVNLISYSDYKKLFGIDLKDVLKLENGIITLKRGDYLPLIKDFMGESISGILYIAPITNVTMQQYSEENTDAVLRLYYNGVAGDDGLALQFSIYKDEEFTFENIKIGYFED